MPPCAMVRVCLWVAQAAGGPTPGAALEEAAAFSGSGASGLASGKEEAVARAPLTVRTRCRLGTLTISKQAAVLLAPLKVHVSRS